MTRRRRSPELLAEIRRRKGNGAKRHEVQAWDDVPELGGCEGLQMTFEAYVYFEIYNLARVKIQELRLSLLPTIPSYTDTFRSE